jgi:hypothetical protein
MIVCRPAKCKVFHSLSNNSQHPSSLLLGQLILLSLVHDRELHHARPNKTAPPSSSNGRNLAIGHSRLMPEDVGQGVQGAKGTRSFCIWRDNDGALGSSETGQDIFRLLFRFRPMALSRWPKVSGATQRPCFICRYLSSIVIIHLNHLKHPVFFPPSPQNTKQGRNGP